MEDATWRKFTPDVVDNALCMARTWNGGVGGQCTRTPLSGSEFCSMHGANDKWQVHGRLDGPIPDKKLREFERCCNPQGKMPVPREAAEKRPPATKRKQVPMEEDEVPLQGLSSGGSTASTTAPSSPGRDRRSDEPKPFKRKASGNSNAAKEKPKRCTCGQQIHTEKCAAFKAYHQTAPVFGPGPAFTKQAYREATPSQARPPPSRRDDGYDLPETMSAWAVKELTGIISQIASMPPILRKPAWRQKMLEYHPDKRESHAQRFEGIPDEWLAEVFLEVKSRAEQAAQGSKSNA
mmetsp:Transcript_43000/g.98806  ORF Transcript_43000/g.98806 Transcript_43000/m.98806 type:complete len:293 (-) Transcript_43000:79-957(-)